MNIDFDRKKQRKNNNKLVKIIKISCFLEKSKQKYFFIAIFVNRYINDMIFYKFRGVVFILIFLNN